MTKALLTTATVTLLVPVAVDASDGKPAARSQITLKRPKVRHAKRLAVLIGSDLLESLMAGDGDKASLTDVDGRKLVVDLLGKLLDEDRLYGLTSVIADLAGEDVSVIDDIDLIDLPAVAMAFAGFFPGLQSAIAGLSKPISQPSGGTPQQT